ncbi:laminin subunit alpha-1-like [Diadema antillarum]|uniref:laminin subunit alpha-1-like n=1 Tax=Diadema antillarum TaxID=105358 RepID=UPI003A862734
MSCTQDFAFLVPRMSFKRRLLLGIALLLILSTRSSTVAQTVNVALNKPIAANITCGSPAETFLAHTESSKSPQDRIESTCDANVSSLAHPPRYMVDLDPTTGESYTWWQSTSRLRLIEAGFSSPDSEIILDLQEVHSVESITIQMGDSVRPGQMGVEKSEDGQTYTQWLYQVSSLGECTSLFNVPPVTAVIDSNTVLCTTFLFSEQPRNEMIMFSWSTPNAYQDWQRARFIKINFYDMPRSFGFISNEYHHYTVRNLEVMAPCECNDHNIGCTLQPLTSDPDLETYQCVCGDNTRGQTCNECLPFYNQLPYQPGTNGFVCEQCDCFNHSEVCVYDEAVAASGSSLNVNGDFVGGGVCQDCQNFTAGINCQLCLQFYFRPLTKSQSDEDACQPCNCFLAGTREDALTGLVKGECVMNDDVPNPAGMAPGDCYCKVNVQGSKCNECRDGFYDLTDANTNGCLGCDCFLDGTMNGSNICSKDSSGQCPCKANVGGRRCDVCLDGYYGLTAENENGCLACACDVGAAESPVCNKASGECSCRPLVIGQQCDGVTQDAFYPTLHSISSEFETSDSPFWRRDVDDYFGIGYVELSGMMNASTILSVPPSQLSGGFHIVLRAITEGATTVSVTIRPAGGEQQAAVQRGTADLPICLEEWCYDGVADNVDPLLEDRFQLNPGDWEITVGVNTQGGGRVLLDQVVAIPTEYSDPTPLLGLQRAENFTDVCNIQTNDMRLGTSDEALCLGSVFSLTTFYFDGAMSCDCDITGSVGMTCDACGGQCDCKNGVGGRTCDFCLPEYFSFRATGCTSCDCFGDDKVCDVTTGQCTCPPNTAGRRCDRCVTFTWGLNSTTGCQPCDCNPTGSVSLQCDQTTGQCQCQPGVGGRDCSRCLDGYKELTTEGCARCDCDVDGSLSSVCNPITGQCPCKNNTEGLLCDTCMAGTFYNSEGHPQGCLDCVCMGITSQCDSTQWRSVQYVVPTNEGAVDMWEVFITTSTLEPLPNVTATTIDDTEYVSVVLDAGIQGMWRLPPSDFVGNLLGIYNQLLTFDLVYYYDASGTSAGAVALEAMVTIQSGSEALVYSLGTLEPGDQSPKFVEVSERSGWVVQATGLAPTRAEFLTILTDVTSIFVTASLSTVGHVTSIGDFSYYKATSPDSPNYDASAPRALAVEECQCGPEYQGLSCEECAEGYRRENVTSHDFFGTCVACDCNGHSSACDPTTGQCLDCQDNTGGFNCEVCLDGYYGDATRGTSEDCQPCPCGPPTALSNRCVQLAQVVTCLECAPGHLGPLCDMCADFYYGQPELPDGFCQMCDCNGNTNSCDGVTGECLNCGFSTTGFNCERCQNFTYGNASVPNCQGCNCSPQGSSDLLCDSETGQCPCLPGVTGRRCDGCLPNYFGFGASVGCRECGCNEFGSLALQCDAVGTCSCLAGALGTKCDRCEDGSYGLPDQPCLACSCNGLGSEGGAQAVCDAYTGQCPCKVGVMGRVCDECLPGFINFSSNGCTKCDQCVDTLYNSTGSLESLHTSLQALGSSIQDLQEKDAELRTLDPDVMTTSDALTVLRDDFARLGMEVAAIDSVSYERNVTLLAELATTLSATAEALEGQSTVQRDQVTALYAAAQQTRDNVLSANATVQRFVDTLGTWNDTAALLVDDAMAIGENVSELSVVEQRRVIQTELGRIRNVSLEADSLLAMVMTQALELNRLVALVLSAEAQFQSTRQLVTLTQNALDSVEATLEEAESFMNLSRTDQAYSNRLLSEAEAFLNGVVLSLAQSVQAISDADQTLQEANLIYLGSSQGNAALPLDDGIDQRGVNGWVDGNLRVTGRLGDVQALQANLELTVTTAELRVIALSDQAQQSISIFESAQPVGRLAVAAVQNYRDVVDTVDEARSTVQNASSTLTAAQESLSSRGLLALRAEAQSSRQASTDLLATIEGSAVDTQGLLSQLNSSSETLQDAIGAWDGVRDQVRSLVTEVNALYTVAQDPGIQPVIDAGMEEANQTLENAAEILAAATSLQQSLDRDERGIIFVQDSVNNATTILADLPDQVTQVETNIQTLSTNVDTLTELQNVTATLRSDINDKIARLREKLRLAQNSIADSSQPVRFAGQSSLSIIQSVDTLALYNAIELDVRPDQRDGLVFFMENPAGESFMSIEIIASRINFRFSVSQDVVTVASPIDVCCGDWYHVLATRYADGGELTVTLLSTGGSSSNYERSFSVYERFMQFQPDTTFYVGGIPSDYETDKILSRDFEGCISGVTFDGQELDLWRPDAQEGSASCCPTPVTPEEPTPSYVPGVSFDGFGYYQVPKGDFDVRDQARISLEFRTVLRDGVLFIVTRPDLISYIGIFMVDGRVTFEMNTAGNARYSVPTLRTYDDGHWYQVTASFNGTHYSLETRFANDSSDVLESSTRRTLAPVVFFNLQFSPKLLLGGADPSISRTVVRGPTNLGFAGSIRNLALSNDSLDLTPREITNTSSLPYEGVSFSPILEEVVPGIGFSGEFAYASLNIGDDAIETVDFRFKTMEPHGILVYSYDTTTFNKLLYVTLYHGNIFVQYNLGDGLSDPLQTRGLKLNTGQWQSVRLAFNGLTASLQVNSESTIYGASQLSSTGIAIQGALFLGGVQSTIPVLIGGDYPIRQSLKGDVADFAVNQISPKLNDPNTAVRTQGVDLTGVPPAVTSLPPLPFVTPPPPTGSGIPESCAAPVQVFPYPADQGVVRFGLTRDSYLAVGLNSQEKKYFSTTFVLSFEFRALSPDGIMLYLANGYESPTQFMSLIMEGGFLNLFILDGSRQLTMARTAFKYNDAQWRTLTILKINGFVVLLVSETKDYVRENSDLIGDASAFLEVDTDLYVGGLGPRVLAGQVIVNVNTFNGCIRSMTISTETETNIPISLDPANEDSKNITTCRQNPVSLGGHFDGSGWLLLESQYSVSSQWSLSMTISTTEREALLLVIPEDTQNFITLEIADGTVRTVVGVGSPTSLILRSSQMDSGYGLCDGQPHTILLSIQPGLIELTVDDTGTESLQISGQSSLSISNSPLYIGGVPSDANVPLVTGIITTPFFGCMESLTIGDTSYDLYDAEASSGFILGCPRPIP